MIFQNPTDARSYFSRQVDAGQQCTIHSVFGDTGIVWEVTCSGFAVPDPALPVQKRPTIADIPGIKPIKQMILAPTDIVIELPHELRDYQQEAVHAALLNKHIIIELPTGTGKTTTALAIINEIIKDNPGHSCIVIVPTQVLLTQWIDDGFKASGVEATGVSAMGREWGRFTVTTYQSAIRNIPKVIGYDIIVLDEVHHLFAQGASNILYELARQPDFESKNIIGLTASVRTMGEEKKIQDKYFPARFSKTLREFQQSDLRVPVTFEAIPVPLGEEDMETYQKYSDIIRNVTKKLGPITEWAKFTNSPNPDLKQTAYAGLKAFSARKKLLTEDPNKFRVGMDILRREPGQFIVFADTIAAIQEIEDVLRRNGISEGSIYTGVKPNVRKEIINGLRNGTIKVLVGAQAITEGLDIPSIDNALFMSATYSSQRIMIQRAGRILRPRPGKTATIWILYAPNTIEERNVSSFRGIIGEK